MAASAEIINGTVRMLQTIRRYKRNYFRHDVFVNMMLNTLAYIAHYGNIHDSEKIIKYAYNSGTVIVPYSSYIAPVYPELNIIFRLPKPSASQLPASLREHILKMIYLLKAHEYTTNTLYHNESYIATILEILRYFVIYCNYEALTNFRNNKRKLLFKGPHSVPFFVLKRLIPLAATAAASMSSDSDDSDTDHFAMPPRRIPSAARRNITPPSYSITVEVRSNDASTSSAVPPPPPAIAGPSRTTNVRDQRMPPARERTPDTEDDSDIAFLAQMETAKAESLQMSRETEATSFLTSLKRKAAAIYNNDDTDNEPHFDAEKDRCTKCNLNPKRSKQLDAKFTCSVCTNYVCDLILTCGHMLCSRCFKNLTDTREHPDGINQPPGALQCLYCMEFKNNYAIKIYFPA